MRRFLIVLIRVYKYAISPYMASSCRFTPSCSSYAIESINRFGVFKGLWLALRRVSRCQPWHEGGADPVPAQTIKRDI